MTDALAPAFALLTLFAVQARAQTSAAGDRYSGDAYPAPAYRSAETTGEPSLSWPGKAATPDQPGHAQTGTPQPGSSTAGDRFRSPAYAEAVPPDQRTAPAYPSWTPPTNSPSTAPYPTPAYQAQAVLPPVYQARANPPAVNQRSTPPAHAYAPPPLMPWYERYGAGAAASTSTNGASPPPPGAPQSIYDPAGGQGGAAASSPAGQTAAAVSSTPSPGSMAPPTAPSASATPNGETAHFYSLHRQYGLTPDPDPIPPEFFTQTADLSDPPGPSPVYKSTSASGAAVTSVHAAASDTSTSSLSQP